MSEQASEIDLFGNTPMSLSPVITHSNAIVSSLSAISVVMVKRISTAC